MLDKMVEFISVIGGGISYFISVIVKAATDTLQTVATKMLPFMLFIALLTGIITGTGIGNVIANILAPLGGSLIGLVILVLVCTIPIVSPVLGPGAVIAQVIGVLIGTQIGLGNIAPIYALPAIFAIDGQVGCDFIPISLSMMEAEPETIENGLPAILFSRWITGPIGVIFAYFVALVIM